MPSPARCSAASADFCNSVPSTAITNSSRVACMSAAAANPRAAGRFPCAHTSATPAARTSCVAMPRRRAAGATAISAAEPSLASTPTTVSSSVAMKWRWFTRASSSPSTNCSENASTPSAFAAAASSSLTPARARSASGRFRSLISTLVILAHPTARRDPRRLPGAGSCPGCAVEKDP